MVISENPSGSGDYTFGPGGTVEGDQWCTVADVKAVTGVTVDADTRTRAAILLGTLIGLIEGVKRDDISDRDKHYLKLTTAFQAAWMQDHPDLYSREDVTSASQDGESATYRNADAHLLAPLARKSIRRLSWRGLRSILPTVGNEPTVRNVNSEAFDDSLPWVRV